MEKSLAIVLVFSLSLFAFVGVLILLLNDSGHRVINYDFGPKHTIYIHEYTPLHVEIADTNDKRRTGLSGKTALAPTEGMLFVFNSDDRWRIWMKDMQFGIDIIWLDKDGVVLDIRQYVYPESYPFVFEPGVPARYILEVSAGVSEVQNIHLGDVINLNW